jgi:hypothetical protein
MTKSVKVLADLSIQSGDEFINVKNDQDGSLVFEFPTAKSFNSLSSVPIPFKPGIQSISKVNTTLLEQHQPVILRVDQEDWLVLGRDRKPSVKYFKLVPFYLKKQLTWKTALYITGSGLGAALAYFAIKKRN